MADQYEELRRALAEFQSAPDYSAERARKYLAMQGECQGHVIAALLSELDALREDARKVRIALEHLVDVSMVSMTDVTLCTDETVEAWNNAHDALHPSKDADSGEVGNG